MDQLHEVSGYFSVSLQANGVRLLLTNDERSFIISKLQDLLTPQYINDTLNHFALQSDLLAYSITGRRIQLLVFCIARKAATELAYKIQRNLEWYKSEYQPHNTHVQIFTTISKLRGPHHALEQSVALHLEHEDWEFDRYSSIGFYLHDRRGAWMRLWRMALLYEHDPKHYRSLVVASIRHSKARLLATS